MPMKGMKPTSRVKPRKRRVLLPMNAKEKKGDSINIFLYQVLVPYPDCSSVNGHRRSETLKSQMRSNAKSNTSCPRFTEILTRPITAILSLPIDLQIKYICQRVFQEQSFWVSVAIGLGLSTVLRSNNPNARIAR
jgi:hypothetical protein